MLIVTTHDLPGWEIRRVCGEVFGLTVRSRNAFAQMGEGFKAVALPLVDETPEPLRDSAGAIIYSGFPAGVLYEFRLLSLGAQLLWLTIGVVFGMLAGRLLGDRARRVSSNAA